MKVLLITTSNCAEEAYEAIGYEKMLEEYRQVLDRFVGKTQIFVCGNTLQVDDYSKYQWTMFDPEEKKKHHDESFRHYLDKAYACGMQL